MIDFFKKRGDHVNRWEKELIKLVKVVGEGNDIATLSEQSFRLDEFEEFEAHEIYSIARGSKYLIYDESTQEVFLKSE